MIKFPTQHTESTESLLKQLNHFVRPSGKQPAAPLPRPIDLSNPDDDESPFPNSPAEFDEDRPNKRQRNSPDGHEVTTDELLNGDRPRRGQKGAGKTGGKTSKGARAPRQVIPGTRGLVDVEMDKDGVTHPIGEDGTPVVLSDDDDDDVEQPLAKRPELDDAERKRRTEIKEKEREREEEVVRRLTKDDGERDQQEGEPQDIDVWEGVELVSGRYCLSSLH